MNIRLVRVLARDKKSKERERERERLLWTIFVILSPESISIVVWTAGSECQTNQFFFFPSSSCFYFFFGISFSPIITFTYCNSVLLQQKVKKNNIAVHVN